MLRERIKGFFGQEEAVKGEYDNVIAIHYYLNRLEVVLLIKDAKSVGIPDVRGLESLNNTPQNKFKDLSVGEDRILISTDIDTPWKVKVKYDHYGARIASFS
jgi:hypothetical protein